MGTSATAGKSQKRRVRPWDDVDRATVDAEVPGRAGRALLGVLLVSLALWAGIIFGARALIEAL